MLLQKNKLFLLDYVGQSNDQGEPVGHSVKTLTETLDLLDQIIEVELIIPRNYEQEFLSHKNKIPFFLEYHSRVYVKKFYHRGAGIRGKMNNLRKIFKNCKEGMLWFVHPDFLLFVFLFFYPFKIKNRILITMYMEGYNLSNTLRERIKNFFLKRTIQRVDLVIKNSKKIGLLQDSARGKNLPTDEGGTDQIPGPMSPGKGIRLSEREIFCPDYLYKEDRYKPYLTERNNYILCTGVMNQAKDLLNLVKVWHRSGIKAKLKISGFFPDKRLLREIRKYEKEEIKIIDHYLTREAYYKNIAGARFSILCYKKSRYIRRTSGILLESIFLDTPVIAPDFLLDYTELPGFGYAQLEDIESLLEAADEKKINEMKERMKQVREEYGFEKMKKNIAVVLEDLS